MNTETKHTPTPWILTAPYTNRQATPIGKRRDNIVTDIFAEAHGPNHEFNAAFIVRACNEHAALCAVANSLQIAANQFDFTVKSMSQGHTVSISSLQNCAAMAKQAISNLAAIRNKK